MASIPKPKFTTLGKSKFVHVVRTEKWDRKNSGCQQVRKFMVAGKIDYKHKGLSPSAAAALDACPHCHTDEVIGESMTPAERKAAAKAKRDDTLDKIRDEQLTNADRKKRDKKRAKAAKEPAKQKDGKAKGKSSSKTAGPRSSGGDSKSKAEALAAFGKEHGWASAINAFKDEPGVLVEATRGGEIIRCWFVDGKYDTTRHATLTVGTWTGKLRGVHGCRKQMAGEGRDRPHPNPGSGRSAARKSKGKVDEVVPEDESPEDAHKRVPFNLDDDALEIIDAVKGRMIKWRNGLSGGIEAAQLPSTVRPKRGSREAKRDVLAITEHPKTGKRMINFLMVMSINEDGEVYGSERTVALDKIVRVVG